MAGGVSEDPIEFRGGQLNLHAYVWDSPTNYVDQAGTGGVGVTVGGSTAVGLGWGAGATWSVSLGIFWGGDGGVNFGSFVTTGAFAGGEGQGWAYPGQSQGGPNGALGGFLGLGLGGFWTNATSSDQLGGPFDTLTLNAGPAEFQHASSGQIWENSLTGGVGCCGGISYMSTNTFPAKSCWRGGFPTMDPVPGDSPQDWGVPF